MLVITVPAPDLTLLTMQELRLAIDEDTGRDAEIKALGARVASAITKACQVASVGTTTPTLRQETLTETIRRDHLYHGGNFSFQDGRHGFEYLIPSRRPISSITSITEDGVLLDPTAYEIEGFMIRRLYNDMSSRWNALKTVVVYVAGWATVPDDLKLIAAKLAHAYWAEQSINPRLRSENIPGVYSASYKDRQDNEPGIPADIADLLQQGGYVTDFIA